MVLYSVYDYFEHIGRPGSIFEEHPYHWLFFTTGAVFTLFVVVYSCKYLIEKMFKKKSLLFEVLAVGIWATTYLTLLGPLVNSLFWPFDDLFFSFKLIPLTIILGGYSIIRVFINLIMKKKILFGI